MQSLEKIGSAEFQSELELQFIDFETASPRFRLIDGDKEEKFDDMRVRSVIEQAQDPFVVEKHDEQLRKRFFFDYNTLKLVLKGIRALKMNFKAV